MGNQSRADELKQCIPWLNFAASLAPIQLFANGSKFIRGGKTKFVSKKI